MTVVILADLGVKAFYLLYLWLASAWIAGELSRRKGYGEKWGLGSGLLLSVIGVLVWLIVPARADSIWKQRGWRRAKAERVDSGTTKRA